MNSQERELFWNTLVSLPGEDIQAEYQKLFNTIKLPKYLNNGRDTMWNTQTEELSDELSSNCETDAEKVKVFHKWIVEIFEYDF